MLSPLPINDTCLPTNTMPDAWNIAGLPLNITTYITPAEDSLYAAVASCCSPSPVGLADGCYFWCEQPPSQTDVDV